MIKRLSILALSLTAVLASVGHAHDFKQGDITITHPYSRPTTPGIQSGAAWFGITNAGQQDDRIVGASSEVARHTEIHDMKIENDVMRMFKIDGIDVPAGATVKLGDGNKLHVMLMELKQPLQLGDKFTLNVEMERAGSIPVEVWVEKPRVGGGHDHDHDHSHAGHGAHEGQGSAHQH